MIGGYYKYNQAALHNSLAVPGSQQETHRGSPNNSAHFFLSTAERKLQAYITARESLFTQSISLCGHVELAVTAASARAHWSEVALRRPWCAALRGERVRSSCHRLETSTVELIAGPAQPWSFPPASTILYFPLYLLSTLHSTYTIPTPPPNHPLPHPILPTHKNVTYTQ